MKTDWEIKRDVWMEAYHNSDFGKWLDSMTEEERSKMWQEWEEEECRQMEENER